MSNPLFKQFGNPYGGMVEQFNKFAHQIQGNPQEQVQQLLNSGKVTQDQYNQAVQTAQQLSRMLGMK